ncbi:MAG TPA: type II toxin-antitoxin system death-on-curing family toxin [archaeon]|nr:type II toxin-antitoxin system death-on-curing family toxin [archaeon]
MAGAGKVLKATLGLDDIIKIHHDMVLEFGGGFFIASEKNLINPGSLYYVLEEIQGFVFGYDRYRTVIEKAAILAWRIIQEHVFFDGNKRTGMAACEALLKLNHYDMLIDEELITMAISIAEKKVEYSDFVKWLREKTTKA